MADGNAIGPRGGSRPLQERVPHATGGVFDRQAVSPGVGAHIFRLDDNRQPEPNGKRPAESRVVIGGGAQPMIQVRETGNGEVSMLGERQQRPDERD